MEHTACCSVAGQSAAGLLTVVFTVLPRIAPESPICRPVVHRATAIPSRRNCRPTLRTP